MVYNIQPHIHCENCIKCGGKPVIEQAKSVWKVKCPNKACNNEVSGPLLDIEQWNRKNQPDVNLYRSSGAVKNTA